MGSTISGGTWCSSVGSDIHLRSDEACFLIISFSWFAVAVSCTFLALSLFRAMMSAIRLDDSISTFCLYVLYVFQSLSFAALYLASYLSRTFSRYVVRLSLKFCA